MLLLSQDRILWFPNRGVVQTQCPVYSGHAEGPPRRSSCNFFSPFFCASHLSFLLLILPTFSPLHHPPHLCLLSPGRGSGHQDTTCNLPAELLGGCSSGEGGPQTWGHHWDNVPPREHGGSSGDDRGAHLPCGAWGMSGESMGPPPCLPGFEVTARGALCVRWWQPSLAEGSAVPRAMSQGCSRSFSGWSLHWCQRQLPPFRIQSRGPETPCDITCCSPRRPEPAAEDGPPRHGGPHLPVLPPSPRPRHASRLGQPVGEPALSNPGQKPAGWPGEAISASPSRQEVGQQNAAAAATRDNRVATVQSVIQQTATCRGTPAQSDRPTAQPDAEECLKLQHEQTRLHIWKQLALEAAIWKFSLVT